MKTKLLSFIMVLVLAVSLVAFTGCQQQASPATQPNAEETKEESKENYFAGKTVSLICPWGAGGSVDLSGRILAKYAEKYLGCTIVVENITGGSGSVGYTEALKRGNDGLTLAIAASPLVTHTYLLEGVTYDYDSFEPIIMTTKEPNMIVVKAGSKFDIPAVEFLKYAKENPGKVLMGVGGHWASHDVARAALQLESGIQFKKVAFDGGSEVVANILGGHVDCGFNYYGEFKSQVDAGEFVVLAGTGDTRHPYLPDVPTLNELSKEFGEEWNLSTIGSWKGIAAPKGTPQEVLDALRNAFYQASQDNEFKAAMEEAGLPYLVYDWEKFGKLMADDSAFAKNITAKLKEEGKQ